MFAIIQSGGRQVKVTPGDTISVDRFEASAGDEVTIDQVLVLEKEGGEVLAGALQEALLAEPAPLALRQEGDVHARDAAALGHLDRRRRQDRLVDGAVGTGPDQQARSRHRRERHGDLQLGVIAPAGLHVGIGPAVVEHVLALAVRLEIAGRAAGDPAAPVPQNEVAGRPPGAPAHGAGITVASLGRPPPAPRSAGCSLRGLPGP